LEEWNLAPPPGAADPHAHEASGSTTRHVHRGGVYRSRCRADRSEARASSKPSATASRVQDRRPLVYASGTPLQPVGSYGESRNIPAAARREDCRRRHVEQAAAMMLKRMTVQSLIKRLYKVKRRHRRLSCGGRSVGSSPASG